MADRKAPTEQKPTQPSASERDAVAAGRRTQVKDSHDRYANVEVPAATSK